MANEKKKPRKCEIEASPRACDSCGKTISIMVHVGTRCVDPEKLPSPKPGDHDTLRPAVLICDDCLFRKNMDRLS